MEHQHPKMREIVVIVLGIVAFLFGLYSFVAHQQRVRNALREEAAANRIYDSISQDFAHFTYKESSSSAEVIDRYYLTNELNNLSTSGTFSATIKTVIPKTITRDVHLEWPKSKKDTKSAIFTRFLLDPGYLVTSLTTPENFVVLPISKYKDVVVKIRMCDSKNCADSKELYIPQEQFPQFNLSVEKTNGRALLTWDIVKDAIKYNIFKRNSTTEAYKRAVMHTKETQASIGHDGTKDAYFMVQACNTTTCWSSNEVIVE